jgi:tRNA threonylcarbamoyladenosine biosynthesis protein TsaE
VTGPSPSERFIDLADQAATEALARRLALAARPGDVLALSGPLGAGKSVLARAFVRALTKPDEEVPSPTFTLVQHYDGAAGTVRHFDLYRVVQAEEALELGFEDGLEHSITLIEWPERLGGLLPGRRLEIALDDTGAPEARRVRLAARGGSTLLQRAFG